MKAVPGILPTLLEMICFFSTPTIDVEPKKPQRKFRRGFSVYSKLLLGLGLDLAKRVTVIGQAIFAHPVRQPVSPALGTSHDTGSLQLPNGAAPLIAPGLGHFSLRNRHG